MKKYLSIKIITGLFIILCNQLPAQIIYPSSSPYLDSCFQTTMQDDHIPGISACMIKGGEIRWIGIYGYANFELDIPVDTSTLFMLASVSKTITVTALMQLWDEGLFELDDDINEYLDFEVKHPVDSLTPITFRMLCTHTSGIKDNWGLMPNYFGGDSPIRLGEYLFNYLDQEGDNYDSTLNFYYNQEPGTEYNYSNIGAALIGFLAEEIGDSTFSYQTQQNIFEPLQMYETAWFLSELDTMHIAMPYAWNGTAYIPYGHYGYSDYPAGQLRTSVDQLANFLLCYKEGGSYLGQQILQESTVQEMLTLQVPLIDPRQGLIWYRVPSEEELWWGHTGGHLGVSTAMFFCPEKDYGHIILTNGSNLYYSIGSLAHILYNYAEDSIPITSVPSYYAEQKTVISNIWPNPIAEKTTIKYVLEKPDIITLKILNLDGIELVTLVDKKQMAGEHSITFNGLDLPAGIYFCVLKTNNRVQTIKMIKL